MAPRLGQTEGEAGRRVKPIDSITVLDSAYAILITPMSPKTFGLSKSFHYLNLSNTISDI